VLLTSLTLVDFRNIAEASVDFPEGTTVITGPNGAGKSNLLEAVGWLASLRSFRGAPREALVRHGAESAVIRGRTRVGERAVDIEAELRTAGRSRAMVNRQAVRRRTDLHDSLRCTVFSPQDIVVVRGGPSERRTFLDDVLENVDPKLARSVEDTDRILRQRAAVLRDAHRRPAAEVTSSLDVWDERLSDLGTRLAEAREHLVDQLHPLVVSHYDRLAGQASDVTTTYVRSWKGPLADALAVHRHVDLARGVSSVGPHRDDLELLVGGLPARTHTSQGEQRSLALAMRLSAHQLATERTGHPPVLLLDDVFSELDDDRRRALVTGLPEGQALVTSAVAAPPDVAVAQLIEVHPGGDVRPQTRQP
jgi:DNA replication and repair protein RecF